tara:strand:+ start:1578 stop:1970 length:393 start_codon:yes stop_codon:yes gene_type:complete
MGQREFNGKYEEILESKDELTTELVDKFIDRRQYTRKAEQSCLKLIREANHSFFTTFIIRYNQLHEIEQIRQGNYAKKFGAWIRRVSMRDKLPLHNKCVEMALGYAINAHYNEFKELNLANYMKSYHKMD